MRSDSISSDALYQATLCFLQIRNAKNEGSNEEYVPKEEMRIETFLPKSDAARNPHHNGKATFSGQCQVISFVYWPLAFGW